MLTRNVNGAIQINDKKINMLLLSYWLQNTHRIETEQLIRPNQVDITILKQFIEQEAKAFR